MTLPYLPLHNMSDRHQGLTPAVAESYLEAARVTLSRHHESPQEFTLRKFFYESNEAFDIVVAWEPPDENCLRAWANHDDATRDGAYACAIAAAELSLGLYAISRAETLTGADYYVAPLGQTIEDLESCFRLEVSGTNLDESRVRRRLSEKVQQALEGQSNLPALAIVVGFRVKVIFSRFVEEQL